MRFFPAFCLTAYLLIAMPAFAQDAAPAAIGTVAETEGAVAISHEGKPAVAQIGQAVYTNDIIETGPGARALILFIDETELTLGENARTAIDEYIFDAETPGASKGYFSILQGPFIFTTGLLKQASPDVKIETAYGTIGIRGTTVWGGLLDDQYNVFVADGAVDFATSRGMVRVKAGQGTKVRGRNYIPDRARQWAEEKIGRATRTIALQNAERARERVARMKKQHAAMRERHREFVRQRREQRNEHKQQQRQRHRENLQQRQEREQKIREDRRETWQKQKQDRIENRNNAREMDRRERKRNRPGPPGR